MVNLVKLFPSAERSQWTKRFSDHPKGVTPPGCPSEEEATAFMVEGVRALHRYGANCYRVEEAITKVGEALGLQVEALSLPTQVMLAFGPPESQRVIVLRLAPAELDLGRLGRADEILRAVVNGEMGLTEARLQMSPLLDAPHPWPTWAVYLAFVLSSMAAATLFGGTVEDTVISGAAGLVVAVVMRLSERWSALSRGMVTLSVFGAAAAAYGLGGLIGGSNPTLVILSGAIVLVPGLSMTLAVLELTNRSLVSGVARIANALLTLLSMGVGVLLSEAVFQDHVKVVGEGVPTPMALKIVLLLVAPVAFGVIFRARRRQIAPVWWASMLAFATANLGNMVLGPLVGGAVGAFILTLFSNLYARWTDTPAQVPLVPGVLLLVPGSIGFRSISYLLSGQVTQGVEAAFQMSMVAVALAAGISLAQSFWAPRRAL